MIQSNRFEPQASLYFVSLRRNAVTTTNHVQADQDSAQLALAEVCGIDNRALRITEATHVVEAAQTAPPVKQRNTALITASYLQRDPWRTGAYFRIAKGGPRRMKALAAVLIVVGVGIVIWGAFGFTTREKVVDIGPIHASKDKQHNVPYGPVAGAVLALGGVVLLVRGKG